MPTAAKLAGAVFFALLAVALAVYVPQILPAGMARGRLLPVAVVIAALTGWRVAGTALTVAPDRPKSHAEAASIGMRTAVIALLVALFAFAVGEMARQALRKIYDGPVDALVGVFEELVEFLPPLADPTFVAILLLGGALAGVLTGLVGRRWR